MTKEGLTSREVAWEFEATFLARMLRREPRSFVAGLLNLDEADVVSMMSTDAATSDCCYGCKHRGSGKSGSNQGLPLERFRKVLASERQRPCPYCTNSFMSENDEQGGFPSR